MRQACEGRLNIPGQFQSTHSLRSATPYFNLIFFHSISFNPRTPCGVRLNPQRRYETVIVFQSTHSLRSATKWKPFVTNGKKVSIHALLAECDRPARAGLISQGSFNPRTPCGVRPHTSISFSFIVLVSIHALLAECDQVEAICHEWEESFNPRTPCGVRHPIAQLNKCSMWFQSTHSLRSATKLRNQNHRKVQGFQSTHSLRSATIYGAGLPAAQAVSIHALLAECDPH